MASYGLGVSRVKTSSLFGVRRAVRAVSEGEGTGVLLCSCVSERAEAQMAQQETV
jgi:hypothetical protein